ncbi:MAG: hypothetical protein FRX49_03535 [Trebouxia sp. A1-2]|nr:MAG: hypothetical protein FRX49_03535 [Trebouxia sp. A1-2]
MKPMSIMMKEFSLQTVELAAPPHPSVDLSEACMERDPAGLRWHLSFTRTQHHMLPNMLTVFLGPALAERLRLFQESADLEVALDCVQQDCVPVR